MAPARIAIICGLLLGVAGPSLSADDPNERLDVLLSDLASASADDAPAIESRIQEIWADAPSDTVDVLYERAEIAAALGRAEDAAALLDHILILSPDFAQGWAERARHRLREDDFSGALSDLQRALDIEPRHFTALADLGGAFLALGNEDAALEAFREAVAINPHLEDAQAAIDRLKRDVEGQGI
ncbi:MAG: tetratricopeptide repeat protein [Pseudomonadota bacterium]